MSHDRRFRFGVHTSDAGSGEDWADSARRYESLGFSTLLLRDHFDHQLAPLVAMTAAACATESLRVGCLVLDNDYRHPLVLAKELATLDRLSGGRVEVGLGAGWMAPDYSQAGIAFDPPATRVDRLEEAVTVVKALLAGGVVDLDGEHYMITGHEPYPQPVQEPPPLMIAGGGPRMLRLAAREADIVGLNPARKSNAAWDDQNLADATAEATDRKIGWIREAAGARYDDLELSIVVPFVIVTDDREATAEAIAASLPADDPGPEVGVETVLSSPYVLVGDLDQICDTMRARRDRWDLSYYVVNDDAVDAVAPIVDRLAGS
ncbi:MAG TPA: TIGR03621 family F420-dependent LLM class oxidoreductase [Acidimicrobiia bacterium]|nr:TIGR03621 family F420-dependent LLM class oxidoreductase [Acidimicrobiia bacterium]